MRTRQNFNRLRLLQQSHHNSFPSQVQIHFWIRFWNESRHQLRSNTKYNRIIAHNRDALDKEIKCCALEHELDEFNTGNALAEC